jgi:diguanylate cyclase (GGDEF)-like protein
MSAGLYCLSARIIFPSYLDLERQQVERNNQRAIQAFQQIASDLHVKAVDWAEWDDTYRFMTNHNREYIDSNLEPGAFPKMKVDAIVYLDRSLRVFESQTAPRIRGVAPPLPSDIVGKAAPLLRGRGPLTSAFGAVEVRGHPVFLSIRPILSSAGRGPSRGWIVFARLFGGPEIGEIAERTRLDVEYRSLSDAAMPADFRKGVALALQHRGEASNPRSERVIDGYSVLKGLDGKPAFAARVVGHRGIYAQGVRTLKLYQLTAAGVTIGLSLLLFALMETYVVRRVASLSRQVERCGDRAVSRRVELGGKDELSWLAGRINGMLDTISADSKQIRENETKLRLYNLQLEELVEKRTRQIEHQAFHDLLTGLPNRGLFRDRMTQALARSQRSGRPFAVLFLDLDNFKVVNDGQGHEAGDILLKTVADRLSNYVRTGDTVARLGGDEFTVLAEDLASLDEAVALAERVIEHLKAPIRLPQSEFFLSMSVGIALSTGSEDADVMLRNADTAMYHAKAAGKGCHAVFNQAMNDRVVEQLEVENGLRRAIAKNEFEVYYQPLLDLEEGTISGVEALIRWNHPTLGIVPPAKFIPVAEDTGLIIPIGLFVLERACLDVGAWHQEFPDRARMMLNVNISGKQLQRADIVEQVKDVLDRTGYEPSLLKLEITESTLMADVEQVTEKLYALKALGIRLAIDDFGTGYSSMSSISNLPVDTIKIDKSFISSIVEHEEAAAIVSAILMISKTLSMDVTAEGIETPDQVSKLQGLGCPSGQGFHFAHPLRAGELAEKLKEGPASLVASLRGNQADLVEQMLRELDDEQIPKAA